MQSQLDSASECHSLKTLHSSRLKRCTSCLAPNDVASAVLQPLSCPPAASPCSPATHVQYALQSLTLAPPCHAPSLPLTAGAMLTRAKPTSSSSTFRHQLPSQNRMRWSCWARGAGAGGRWRAGVWVIYRSSEWSGCKELSGKGRERLRRGSMAEWEERRPQGIRSG